MRRHKRDRAGRAEDMITFARVVEAGSLTRAARSLGTTRSAVSKSISRLEDRLGTAVPFFCYPRGSVNEAVRRIVRDEGYRAACSTMPGLNDRRTDLFGLRRTYISRRDPPSEFAKKMAGAYDLLQQALIAWRGLRLR